MVGGACGGVAVQQGGQSAVEKGGDAGFCGECNHRDNGGCDSAQVKVSSQNDHHSCLRSLNRAIHFLQGLAAERFLFS